MRSFNKSWPHLNWNLGYEGARTRAATRSAFVQGGELMVGGRHLASALRSFLEMVVVNGTSHLGGAAVAADMKPLIKAPPPFVTSKPHLFRVGACRRF